MCAVKTATPQTAEPDVTIAAATFKTKRALPAGPNSPDNRVWTVTGAAALGERILAKDGDNYVVRSIEGNLGFVLKGKLVAVWDRGAVLRLKGNVSEVQRTENLEHNIALSPSGGLEYDPNSPGWQFGILADGKAWDVGQIDSLGNLTIYRVLGGRFPLTQAESPSFGSNYVIDVSGVTHLSQDRLQSLGRLDPQTIVDPNSRVAFDTGWTLPTSAVEQADSGVSWNNDANILLDDGNAAKATISNGGFTKTIHALNYAFALPTTGILSVQGIKSKVSRSEEGAGSASKDETIQAVIGSSQVGDNKAITNNWPDESNDVFQEYGAPDDRWGISEFQKGSDLLASDFGLAVKAENTMFSGTRTLRLQNVQMRIFGDEFKNLYNVKMNLRKIIDGGL